MKTPEKIKEMFNSIANKYDFINALISFGLHKKTKQNALKLLNIKNSDKILDLCTGTGDLVYFLSQMNKNVEIVGADFSKNMLEIAKQKNKHNSAEFMFADGTDLPFEDNSFDIITIGFGLRNIENYKKALSEIRRVLKPNGQFLHLDFSCENVFSNFVFDFLTPKLVKIFYKNAVPYEYLVQSKKEFLNTDSRIKMIEELEFYFEKKKTFVMNAISAELFKKNEA